MRAVRPDESAAFASAPATRRAVMAAAWPLLAAKKRAVTPLSSLASTLQPVPTLLILSFLPISLSAGGDTLHLPLVLQLVLLLTSATIAPTWPPSAASNRGVRPYASAALGSAPSERRAVIAAVCPFIAAKKIGVRRSTSRAFMSAFPMPHLPPHNAAMTST